jgi:hypothetical protein
MLAKGSADDEEKKSNDNCKNGVACPAKLKQETRLLN